ncbi:hypothetical protein OAO01_00665 [Oligoflexia bacterium]|nr:hypothetical protein [Oligoflexia bacterium]
MVDVIDYKQHKHVTRRLVTGEDATTLVELLVTLLLSSIFLGVVYDTFITNSNIMMESEVVSTTDSKARAILDLMSFEIRMMGAGMPIGQAEFLSGQSGLGDAPDALLAGSDDDTLMFRMNETGYTTFSSTDFTPDDGLSFSIVSTSDVQVDDVIYISDMAVGGSDGFRGQISSVLGSQLTVDAGYVASEDAIFPSGSTVARTTEITYTSPPGGSGITRSNGGDALVLGTGTSFSLEYLDEDGDEVDPPLSLTERVNEITAIQITVNAQSSRPLKDGTFYTAEAEQIVALRNLNLNH